MELKLVHQQSKYNNCHCNWFDSSNISLVSKMLDSEEAFSAHLVVKIHFPSCIKNLKMG